MHDRYWYTEVNQLAAHWAQVTGYPLKTVVGVLAVLSPQQTWEMNKRWAYEVLARKRPACWGFKANHKKALRIKRGERPRNVIGGLKSRSFYVNILRPSNRGAVTLDRHMFAILRFDKWITPKRYRTLQQVIINRAAHHNLVPSEYQAILWTAYKRKVAPQ